MDSITLGGIVERTNVKLSAEGKMEYAGGNTLDYK